ncbi:MAG: hypothetical protein J0653_06350 [Deltaproteobacteria bacterium]|nr:hypothetical protein [Deltaproteobacteria bacterium]
MNNGRPFDVQKEIRHQGRVKAIEILLNFEGRNDAAETKRAASNALKRIEGLIGLSQPSAECPEAWLDGMQDIAQALREAIDSPSG